MIEARHDGVRERVASGGERWEEVSVFDSPVVATELKFLNIESVARSPESVINNN